MRYQNWDVLLFPGESRTPIQEFETKCFALNQTYGDVASDRYRNNFESMTLVPILTSFVASLERSAPFRISIHSWERPKPSQLLLSYKTPAEATLFEARVYIDGILVAQRTFDDNVWPEVIGDPDREGQYLRFPKFHREILQQSGWEPSELVGRIKVVMAEGVLRENTPPAPSTARFDRLRDVVAFSFQHAPQDILEYSNIAWPNVKMFSEFSKRAAGQQGPSGSRVSGIPGHEAHSHSPQRLPPIASRSKMSDPDDGYQKLIDTQHRFAVESNRLSKAAASGGRANGSPEQQVVTAKLVVQEDDPFVCSHQTPAAIQHWRSQLRSTSHDVSMSDYISNKTDHSGFNTEMSEISVAKVNFEKRVNEANPEEIAMALSPSRRQELFKILSASNSPATDVGTRPPTNTPQMNADLENKTSATTHSKVWQEARVRARTWSESSSKEHSESNVGQTKDHDSPHHARELKVPTTKLATGPLSSSLSINRQRSASNGSKRKRQSVSSGSGAEALQDTITVAVATPSTSESDKEREYRLQSKSNPSSSGKELD